MFNVRDTKFVPGFNVREPVEEVPGFRVAPAGSILQSSVNIPSSRGRGVGAPDSWGILGQHPSRGQRPTWRFSAADRLACCVLRHRRHCRTSNPLPLATTSARRVGEAATRG